MTPVPFPPRLQAVLDRLGEKARRLASLSPLPTAFRESLDHKLRIELTHGSTAIEGNTLTLRETQLLLDEGIAPAGAKPLREIHETVNHDRALRRVLEFVERAAHLDEEGLRELHRLLLANIDDVRAGSYRTERVMVVGAPLQPIRPDFVPDAMAAFVEWIAASDLHPVILAAEAHYRFVKIHPFYDGNGRTARLLWNWILLANGYPLSVVPAEARGRYLGAIDAADRGDSAGYFELLCECIESSLDQYLDS